jgi:hypothetical protein
MKRKIITFITILILLSTGILSATAINIKEKNEYFKTQTIGALPTTVYVMVTMSEKAKQSLSEDPIEREQLKEELILNSNIKVRGLIWDLWYDGDEHLYDIEKRPGFLNLDDDESTIEDYYIAKAMIKTTNDKGLAINVIDNNRTNNIKGEVVYEKSLKIGRIKIVEACLVTEEEYNNTDDEKNCNNGDTTLYVIVTIDNDVRAVLQTDEGDLQDNINKLMETSKVQITLKDLGGGEYKVKENILLKNNFLKLDETPQDYYVAEYTIETSSLYGFKVEVGLDDTRFHSEIVNEKSIKCGRIKIVEVRITKDPANIIKPKTTLNTPLEYLINMLMSRTKQNFPLLQRLLMN